MTDPQSFSRPMYLPPAPFSLQDAVRCSDLVDIAYDMYSQWKAQGSPHRQSEFHWTSPAKSLFRFGTPIWGDSKIWFISDWEPFAFVAHRADEAFLSIRGTESAEDWIKDAEIGQETYELPNVTGIGQVHEGFFGLYRSMREATLQQLNALTGVKRLYITGHSLGAALAMVAMPDCRANALAGQGVDMLQYNLAGPRVGDAQFASGLNRTMDTNFRVVNSCDLVPELPPSVVGGLVFEHVGTPIVYSAQYGSVGGNHSHTDSYNYALKHPEQPQGPT